VIAAAAIAVLAEDHANCRAPINLLNRARQFARRRVGVFDFSVSRKDAYPVRSAGRGVRPHDIVVQHCSDGIALLFHPIEQMVGSKQSLFFSGKRAKQNGRASAMPGGCRFAEQPRGLQAYCRSGSIVVCSGGFRLRIHYVGRP